MQKKFRLLLAAGIILGLASCTKENLTDCTYSLNVKFNFMGRSQVSDSKGSNPAEATLFLFDKDSLYQGSYTVQGPISNGSSFSVSIPKGYYNVVTLTGDLSSYKLYTQSKEQVSELRKGVTKLNQFRFAPQSGITARNNVAIATAIDKLSWAENTLQPASGSQVIDINLIQIVKNLSVTFKGFPRTISNVFLLPDNDQSLNHQAMPNGNSQPIEVLPYGSTSDAQGIIFSFKMLRPIWEKPILLHFSQPSAGKPDEQLQSSIDIMQLIMQDPSFGSQASIDLNNDYNITITYDPNAPSAFRLTINGWEISHVTPTN